MSCAWFRKKSNTKRTLHFLKDLSRWIGKTNIQCNSNFFIYLPHEHNSERKPTNNTKKTLHFFKNRNLTQNCKDEFRFFAPSIHLMCMIHTKKETKESLKKLWLFRDLLLRIRKKNKDEVTTRAGFFLFKHSPHVHDSHTEKTQDYSDQFQGLKVVFFYKGTTIIYLSK